jgi:hypothetical protein
MPDCLDKRKRGIVLRGMKMADNPKRGKLALSVAEFCEQHSISRALYNTLRAQGKGPREMHVGGITRISVEAAAAWRKRMEREPATHKRGAAARAARRKKSEPKPP